MIDFESSDQPSDLLEKSTDFGTLRELGAEVAEEQLDSGRHFLNEQSATATGNGDGFDGSVSDRTCGPQGHSDSEDN